ncbi:hypothetical protein FDUTEX481_06708 [Tolypothrix sp. PCC 7601]|nr:hypothetical protein FDUTEX481_06708 [Tolypothrix sp. PCC 7601]
MRLLKRQTILDFRFCEKLRAGVPPVEQTFQDGFWIDSTDKSGGLYHQGTIGQYIKIQCNYRHNDSQFCSQLLLEEFE